MLSHPSQNEVTKVEVVGSHLLVVPTLGFLAEIASS
jgi:hypothetical protein